MSKSKPKQRFTVNTKKISDKPPARKWFSNGLTNDRNWEAEVVDRDFKDWFNEKMYFWGPTEEDVLKQAKWWMESLKDEEPPPGGTYHFD